MKKILYLAANPKNTTKLRLDEEVREIREGLRRSEQRSQFEIESAWAVRVRDIRRAILDYNPNIIHFSGHGAGEQGLVFEDDAGKGQLVDGEALAELCSLFNQQIECIVLNACYSDIQAQKIGQCINYVIGMNKAIGDRAAIEFSVGFYDGLGNGRDYEFSYNLGCNAIRLMGIGEHLTPVLYTNLNSKPNSTTTLSLITLEYPTGSVPINSLFYIERPPVENDCYTTVTQLGSLIRIKAPRQMGKTSSMKRILVEAENHDYHTVLLSFQSVDDELLTNLEQFLQWFCCSVADELKLPDKLEDYWKGAGNKIKCRNYFERYLLSQLPHPLVLGLDEVDVIFPHPEIAQGFFSMLRAWHDTGKDNPKWQKLRLIITHSKEVYIPLDINQSPFNVGVPIELAEFNVAQVEDLIKRHDIKLNRELVESLMNLCGGHPFLTRLALYEIVKQKISLKEFIEIAPTEQGCYSEHLRRHLENLHEHPSLLNAFKQVISAKVPIPIESSEAFKLRSMGLVKYQKSAVFPACDLYRLYFCDRLGVNNL